MKVDLDTEGFGILIVVFLRQENPSKSLGEMR
jgi:hypothetical protein